MFTNTYLPHVGGVARSVSTYEEEFCRRGHEVRIVAPEFEGAEDRADACSAHRRSSGSTAAIFPCGFPSRG